MLKEARHSKIIDVVNERNYVSFHELMFLTSSSESTIRSDLVELSKKGKIIRLHGGAQSINKKSISFELSLETKMDIEVEAKKKIAEYASALVNDHSMIYVDAGTTTYYFVDALKAVGVKAVTNSYTIARKLKDKGYQVYMVGGEFKLRTDAFIGSITREIISKFSFDIGFFGCNGIDLKQGITTPDFEEAAIKKAAINQCEKVYILGDHTKIGVKTAVSFHPFIGEDIIVDRIDDKSYLGKGIKEAK